MKANKIITIFNKNNAKMYFKLSIINIPANAFLLILIKINKVGIKTGKLNIDSKTDEFFAFEDKAEINVNNDEMALLPKITDIKNNNSFLTIFPRNMLKSILVNILNKNINAIL